MRWKQHNTVTELRNKFNITIGLKRKFPLPKKKPPKPKPFTYTYQDKELKINQQIKLRWTPYCEICFMDKKLQCHHINGLKNGHGLENLQIVCWNCHCKIHGRKFPHLKRFLKIPV